MDDFFSNRLALLATMHGKEQVIAPLLKESLGIQVIVPPLFNSDQFGTFTREVERPGTQLEAARRKALAGLASSHSIIHPTPLLALASEGSFGPHPQFPFWVANRELVILVDPQRDAEWVGEVVTSETNFSHQSVRSLEEALRFAQRVGFPEHGLVVMPQEEHPDPQTLIKGIQDRAELEAAVHKTLKRSARIHLETDMRALYNPTRMKAIGLATAALIQKLQSRCPDCHWPGFSEVASRRGLPCSACGFPTEVRRISISQCQRCGFSQEHPFPDGIQAADPAQCNFCNP